MTEMRVSNPLYGYLLLSFYFRNVGAALEPYSDLLKVEDLVFVRLEQFVSLVGLPSFSGVGMQHLPHHLRQFLGIPALKNIQKLSYLQFVELILIRLSIHFRAISQASRLKYGQPDAEDLRTVILRIVHHSLFLPHSLLTLLGGYITLSLTQQNPLLVLIPPSGVLDRLSRPRKLANNLNVSVFIHQNVLRLHISYYSAQSLQDGCCLDKTVKQVQQFLLIERPFDLPSVDDLRKQRVQIVLISQLSRQMITEASPPVPQYAVCLKLCSMGRNNISQADSSFLINLNSFSHYSQIL